MSNTGWVWVFYANRGSSVDGWSSSVSQCLQHSECLTGNALTLQKCDPLFVGTMEPRTHFEECCGWIHFRMSSDALPLGLKIVSHILSKLDCVVTPFLCWWRSLQKAYWACYILHICAIHCWEMVRAVPNWSCPKWECESITVSSLFNPHMSQKKKKEKSLVQNLSAMPPLPPTAAPGNPWRMLPTTAIQCYW